MNKTKIQNILDLKSRGIVYAFLLLWVIFIGCNIFGVTSFNMGNFTSVLKEGSLVAIAGIGTVSYTHLAERCPAADG